MKRCSLIILLIYCLNFLNLPVAFSQGREYERIRAFSDLAGEPSIGEESFPEYYLTVGDIVRLFVWQNPDITGSATIMPNGKISYPLIGTVKAAGLTLEQLQDILKEKLSKYIKFPQVTVSVEEFSGNKVFLFGEAEKPGVYLYTGMLTLFELMAMAGGVKTTGKRESIIVVSGNLTKSPSAKRVNLFRALREGTSDEDFILQPNDVVYIPRTFIADVNRFIEDLEPAYDKAMAIFDWRDKIRSWYRHAPPSSTISSE